MLILKKITGQLQQIKQKALDADSRAVQQIIFTVKIKATAANTKLRIFYVLEKSKETILEFSKETAKVL